MLGLWGSVVFLLWQSRGQSDGLATLGQIGDAFGSVNALFGGLAFAGVIVALILQTLELKAQREDIRESTAALEGQQRAMDLSIAETKFFRMLDAFRRTADSIEFAVSREGRSVMDRGGLALSSMKDELIELMPILGQDVPESARRLNRTEVLTSFVERRAPGLPHYVEMLRHAISAADGSTIFEEKDKISYVRMLASHLSGSELVVLFYFTVAEDQGSKTQQFSLKELFRRYATFGLLEPTALREIEDRALFED